MTDEMGVGSGGISRIPGLAVAALVLGIAAFIMPVLGIILAILALIFGVRAKNRIDSSQGGLRGSGLAIAGIVCGAVGLAVSLVGLFLVVAITIPSFVGFHVAAKEAELESNMHAVQEAAEEFASLAGGYYPASINTSVAEVLIELGEKGGVSSSIADARGRDPAKGSDIDATGNALLPQDFKNPWNGDLSDPAVGTSREGEPTWSQEEMGIVWYVPLGVEGSYAEGYEIYGTGKWEIIDLMLSSDDWDG